MSVFKRISDIISANLNELTEQYEDPELMLKEAIREMEDSISEATQQTAKTIANEKVLARELERNRSQAKQWQDRAEMAVESSDDELARKALSRKREHDKVVVALEDQLEAARDASQALRRQLDAMKAKLAEAKRNLTTLSARQRAANFRKNVESFSAGVTTRTEDDAFVKFDRLRAKVEQAEAEADALSELSDRPAAVVPEIEPAGDELDVEAELAELKRHTKGREGK